MKRKLVLILSVTLLSGTAFSQEGLSSIEKMLDRVNRDIYFSPNTVRYEAIDGTPYLSESFSKGLVIMNSGDTLTGEFRFDIYANQIEFKKKEAILCISVPDSIIKIELEDYTLVYKKFKTGFETRKGYLVVLEEGDISLFLQRNKILYQAEPPRPYQDPRPARFENGKDLLFMQSGDNPAEKIAKEEDVIRICGDRGAEAKKFVDKEKLNLKKQSDIIELVKYLNQK